MSLAIELPPKSSALPQAPVIAACAAPLQGGAGPAVHADGEALKRLRESECQGVKLWSDEAIAALDLAPMTICRETTVKQPLINAEETIDRIVGRRTKSADRLSMSTVTKENSRAWRKALDGGGGCGK